MKLMFVIGAPVYFLLLFSCNNSVKNESVDKGLNYTLDKKFTDFFARNCCGLTGSDGYYSVLLPDGRTVWMLGDSFLGTVKNDGTREKRNPIFVRNTFAIQDADSLKTLYNIIDGKDASCIIHPDAMNKSVFSEDSIWYWPGDGFIENGELKVFISKFHQAKADMWGFKWGATDIATFTLPELQLKSIDPIYYPHKNEVHWGHAVCDDDPDYTYIYGLGKTKPYVARAPKSSVMEPWEFFTGTSWVTNSEQAKPMINVHGSEQFSVFKLEDKFVYLSQKGNLSDEIFSYVSENPYSGWTNRSIIAKAHPPIADTNLFVYNAVAHPQFISNGQLLVSYCVNSFKVEDLFEDAQKYRPIFLRIPINEILE